MMMRKRLFYWLVSFYVFVVQVVIVAHLWQDSRVYLLAGINFLVLLFFSFLFSFVHRSSDYHRVSVSDKKKSVSREKRVTHRSYGLWKRIYYIFQHYLFVIVLVFLPIMMALYVVFGRGLLIVWCLIIIFAILFVFLLKPLIHKKIYFINRKFSSRSILFVLSLFIGLVLFVWIKNSGNTLRLSLFVSLLLAFILFLLGIKVFRIRRMKSLWSFGSVKLYSFALLLVVIIFVVGGYFNLLEKERYNKDGSWLYSIWISIEHTTEKLLGSFTMSRTDSMSDIASGETSSSDIDYSSGQVLDVHIDDTQVSTGGNSLNVVLEPRGTILRNADKYTEDEPLEYRDVIVYLIDDTDTALASDSYDISFKYISKQNTDYKYFKTAYYKKLIGTALKPTAKVKCDNYLVMKGILEGRDVSKYTGDIFQKYYTKAGELGLLNGCERGSYLLKGNL